MSGLAPRQVLAHWFPRAGFRWPQKQGSPRILRSDARDSGVQWALIELYGVERKLQKKDAQVLIVDAVTTVTKAFADEGLGMRPGEDILEFLGRAQTFCKLASLMIELVYQIVSARELYKLKTPAAQQEGQRDQMTPLAHAVDDLIDAAGAQWDRWKFSCTPSSWGRPETTTPPARRRRRPRRSRRRRALAELAARVEGLTLYDKDGDVEMGL